jgi:hypothetical protein
MDFSFDADLYLASFRAELRQAMIDWEGRCDPDDFNYLMGVATKLVTHYNVAISAAKFLNVSELYSLQ